MIKCIIDLLFNFPKQISSTNFFLAIKVCLHVIENTYFTPAHKKTILKHATVLFKHETVIKCIIVFIIN